MRRVKATDVEVAGRREAKAIAATLGGHAREARRARHLTQAHIADRIGSSRTCYAGLERGEGENAPLELWVKIGMALDRPLAVAFSRESILDGTSGEPRDAGHLAAQELVLRLGRRHGWDPSVELSTSVARSPLVGDVVFRDDRLRVVFLIEIINRAGDLGATARSSDRKATDLEGLAIQLGGDAGPYRVAVGWLLTDTVANRRIVATYPEFLRTRFHDSSATLVNAVMDGAAPPTKPAIAWIDPRAGRVFAVRWRSGEPSGRLRRERWQGNPRTRSTANFVAMDSEGIGKLQARRQAKAG